MQVPPRLTAKAELVQFQDALETGALGENNCLKKFEGRFERKPMFGLNLIKSTIKLPFRKNPHFLPYGRFLWVFALISIVSGFHHLINRFDSYQVFLAKPDRYCFALLCNDAL